MKTLRKTFAFIRRAAYMQHGRRKAIFWIGILGILLLPSSVFAGSGHCAEFVNVTRENDLGKRAAVTGKTHFVKRPFHSRRGYNGNILLKWTAPPSIICNGESVSYNLEVQNLMPYQKDPTHTLGKVSMAPPGPYNLGVKASHPCPAEPKCYAVVLAHQAGDTVKCTAKVRIPPGSKEGRIISLFQARLDAGPFFGAVAYNYKIVWHKRQPDMQDSDNDDLTDEEERKLGTNPNNRDSDNDGLSDGEEVKLSTNPNNWDSDNDGLSDAEEVKLRTDPNNRDSDNDGLSDGEEVKLRTNPLDPKDQVVTSPVTPSSVIPSRKNTGLSTGMILVADERTVPPGGTVRVPIRVEKGTNIASIGFNLRYDSSVIRIVNVFKGSLLSGANFAYNTKEQNLIRFGFANSRGKSGSGSVAVVTFRAVGREGSKSTLILDKPLITNSSGRKLFASLDHGLVTIERTVIPGDINNDKKVTVLDALMALKMYVKLIPEKKAADVNNDGRVTPEDARLILIMAKPK